jgi:hypothetical protein
MRNSLSRAFFLVSLVACIETAGILAEEGRALAGDTITVAVLGIEASEGVPDSMALGVTEALRQRMSVLPGYHLIQGRDLVEVKLVFSCPDEAPACMSQAAKSLGASRLVFGSIKKAGPDSFDVTLKLFDAEKAVVESWTADQLSRAQSSGPALRAPVQKWIATLTGEALPGKLHLQGGVVGAAVAVDGVAAGVMGSGGLTIANVAAGKHEIVVTKPGYQPANKSVILASGDSRGVAIELAPEGPVPIPAATASAETPAVEPAAQPTETAREELTSGGRIGQKVTAWLALAGGLTGIGLGIYFSALVVDANGKLDPLRRFPCAPAPPVSSGYCNSKGVQDTSPTDFPKATTDWITRTKSAASDDQIYQWVSYGIGTALLATSAVFFYYGYLSHSSGATADARGSSFQFAPVFSHNGVGAMALTTF